MKGMLFFIFMGLFLSLCSCDKPIAGAIDVLDDGIIGKWLRTDVIPSGGLRGEDLRYFDIISAYTFNSDYTYSNKSDFYGFKDEYPDEIIGQSETIGTYQIKGDSIFIYAKQNTAWEKGFKPEPETIEYEDSIAYGSRFEIVGRTLTLYYISYPADAPVPTQMSYERAN